MKMNNKGLSFVELLMAGAISAGVIFLASDFFQRANKETAKTQAVLESTLDRLSFEHRIRSDLFETKYSFNALNVLDDKKRNFYDYNQTGFCESNCDRVLTIKKKASVGNSDASIFFLIKDSTDSVEQIYNPINAYTRVALEASDDSNLKFTSLNKDNILASGAYSPWKLSDEMTNRLLLIYSPNLLYSSPADIGVVPGRVLQFLGWLNQSNYNGSLKAEVVNFQSTNIFNNLDVRTKTPIESEDQLLRSIPFNSGLGIFAFVAPVKMIKYKIKTVKENGKLVGKLYRDDLIDRGKYREYMISNNVESITFKRQTITSATIEMDIEYSKDTK